MNIINIKGSRFYYFATLFFITFNKFNFLCQEVFLLLNDYSVGEAMSLAILLHYDIMNIKKTKLKGRYNMKWVKCPNCDKDVVDTDESCYNCGYEVKKYFDLKNKIGKIRIKRKNKVEYLITLPYFFRQFLSPLSAFFLLLYLR